MSQPQPLSLANPWRCSQPVTVWLCSGTPRVVEFLFHLTAAAGSANCQN